jgi:hypothetical protein
VKTGVETALRQAFTGDDAHCRPAPGLLRPLIDPEAVERWRAAHEGPLILSNAVMSIPFLAH